MKRVQVQRRYAPGVLTLVLDGAIVGSVYQSTLEPGRWLCDVVGPLNRNVTLSARTGTLLSALRYVRSGSLL